MNRGGCILTVRRRSGRTDHRGCGEPVMGASSSIAVKRNLKSAGRTNSALEKVIYTRSTATAITHSAKEHFPYIAAV